MLHDLTQREIHEARGGVDLACLSKRQFPDPATAAKVAHRMSKAKHTRITPFRCPYCNHWHVGRNLGAPKRKAPRRL